MALQTYVRKKNRYARCHLRPCCACSKNYGFLPQLHIPNCVALEVIHETSLLGVTRWNHLTALNCLPHTSPLHPRNCSREMEMVQKKALAIILGATYTNQKSDLTALHLDRLDAQRTELCYNFAVKCVKSTKHCLMFPRIQNMRINSRCNKPYMEYTCQSYRYYNSPIPYLSRLLNSRSKLEACVTVTKNNFACCPPLLYILWLLLFHCYRWIMSGVNQHVTVYQLIKPNIYHSLMQRPFL